MTVDKQTKISFVGFGNMAKAIARGLVHNPQFQLAASSPSLTEDINADGIRTHPNNTAILADADVVLLGVKPKQAPEVFAEIAPYLPKQAVLLSVITGITTEWFTSHSPRLLACVRAMPNIAAQIQQSATPLFATDSVTSEQRALAERIFQAIGKTAWIADEGLLDVFTAVSGSGSAYALLFMEAMIDAAVSLGLDKDTAQTFVLQTVSGAANLGTQSSHSLSELRERVTSPGGTTAAALAVFTSRQFSAIVSDAIEAAYQRANALGQ